MEPWAIEARQLSVFARPVLLLALAAAAAAEPARTTAYRGRPVSYETVDGLAVHAGDVVIGTVASLTAPPAKGDRGDVLTARLAAPHANTDYRWPAATVPYVIDEGFSDEAIATILAAIAEWNAKTVIRVAPRSEEPDFVRFTPASTCLSSVGRIGEEQPLWLHAENGCALRAVIHEIGHAVGLQHEAQREDREDHLMHRPPAAPGTQWPERTHAGSGPFDYASVMHAFTPSRHIDSIPPGLQIGNPGGLSAGDIDGVARMYGQPPAATTITTNPPGLELVIDGIRTATPATLDWAEGSVHTLEAPAAPQVRSRTRHLFGRWNDGAPRVRTVISTPAQRTWFEANFIQQRQATPEALPSTSGIVTVAPQQLAGWHTIRMPVTATATPAQSSNVEFLRWSDGSAANPATWTMTAAPPAWAFFTATAPFRIEAPAPIRVRINEYLYPAPTALLATEFGGSVTLLVDEVQYIPDVPGSRYRFEGWSDGAPQPRTVDLAAAAGSAISARVVLEHQLRASVVGAGQVVLDPPWDSAGYAWYAADATVLATATPADGWEFVAWSDGTRENVAELAMTSPKRVTATFSRTPPLEPCGGSVTLPSPAGAALGYRVDPPPDATALVISATAPAGSPNVDLYVKAIRPGTAEGSWSSAFWYRGWTSWDPAATADHRSESPGNSERVAISAASTPPLDPAASYYVTLVTDRWPRPEILVDLQLQVTRRTAPAPPAGLATPRALTFVGPAAGPAPAPQTVTLTNEGASDMRFSATVAGTAWMLATPATGTIPAGATAEIQIRPLPLGLAADTHNSTVTIDRSGTDGTSIDPLEIPVAFAAY